MIIGWRRFLQGAALEHNNLGNSAKLVQRIAGSTPSRCRKRVERLLSSGKLDQESYRVWQDAIDLCADVWTGRTRPQRVRIDHDIDDDEEWESLGNGGYRRREMIAKEDHTYGN